MAVYRKAGGAWSLLPDSNTIYVKVAGVWIPLGNTKPIGPATCTAVGGDGQVTVSWPAATVPGGSVKRYEVKETTAWGVWWDAGANLSYTKTGLNNGQTYTFIVRAISNDDVPGPNSAPANAAPVAPFNVATGGTVTDVTNYNGTGQTWRVHTFTGNGNFNVTTSAQPFKLLVVAPGGSGGTACPNGSGGAGGGGGVYENNSATIAVGTTAVVVGPSHHNASDYHPNPGPASNSSFGTIVCGGGGGGGTGAWDGKKPEGGGSGGAAGSGGGVAGGSGSSGTRDRNPAGAAQGGEPAHATRGGLTSNITGTSVTYGVGGGGNDGWNPGDTAAGPGSGGGANDPAGGPEANASRAGIVVVAYRIA